MKNKHNFLLGADPELFMTDLEGIPKSAIDIIPGTKEAPYNISEKGHSVQVDNVLLEFNIPPSDNPISMNEDIRFVLEWFENNLPNERTVSIVPSMEFVKSELLHPKANEFGCDPDWNTWTEKTNEPPEADDTLWRSAGGHVHISYENETMDYSAKLVKALDLYLGVPSIIYDSDTERRKLYGSAGSFRFKKYGNSGGVEYRSLSNFWIKRQDHINFIFNQINKAFSFIDKNDEIDSRSDLAKDIIEAINNSDENLAKKIIKNYKIL